MKGSREFPTVKDGPAISRSIVWKAAKMTFFSLTSDDLKQTIKQTINKAKKLNEILNTQSIIRVQ